VDNGLVTDAGAAGWGGLMFNDSFSRLNTCMFRPSEIMLDPSVQVAQGYLTPEEQGLSSTLRELMAIERTLLSLEHVLSGRNIRLYTDNQAVSYI
jgi:hypothetical protein